MNNHRKGRRKRIADSCRGQGHGHGEQSLTKEQIGRISFDVLVYKCMKDGLTIGNSTRADVRKMAHELGLPIEQAMQFSRLLAEEIANRAFSIGGGH